MLIICKYRATLTQFSRSPPFLGYFVFAIKLNNHWQKFFILATKEEVNAIQAFRLQDTSCCDAVCGDNAV